MEIFHAVETDITCGKLTLEIDARKSTKTYRLTEGQAALRVEIHRELDEAALLGQSGSLRDVFGDLDCSIQIAFAPVPHRSRDLRMKCTGSGSNFHAKRRHCDGRTPGPHAVAEWIPARGGPERTVACLSSARGPPRITKAKASGTRATRSTRASRGDR